MIKFRAPNFDDKDLDNCGGMTVAVIEIDSICIPLCGECVKDLFRDIKEYQETVFCKDCAHWYMSTSGARYGGTCDKELLNKEGKTIQDIKPSQYGYIYCKSNMDTCKDAVKR